MKISLGWAAAPIGAASTSAAKAAVQIVRILMTLSFRSMGKRPQSELLLRDLPEPGQAARLDDQEKDDQSAEHHQLDLLLQCDGQPEPDRVRRVREHDRHQHDEGGAEERAQDAP